MPLVDNAAGLIWLANQGCIEFHPWSSRLPDLEQPDQAVFDLDPGDEASFDEVLQAALWLREELERKAIRSRLWLRVGPRIAGIRSASTTLRTASLARWLLPT